jgi:hypothetical protein
VVSPGTWTYLESMTGTVSGSFQTLFLEYAPGKFYQLGTVGNPVTAYTLMT